MNLGEFIDKLQSMPSSSKIILRGECLRDIFVGPFVDENHLNEISDSRRIYCYPKKKVYFYHFIDEIPGFFHSYRGYYEDIALSISVKDRGYTVSDILTEARKCIGFCFEGYKGGLFTMNTDSRLWMAIYGDNSQFRCNEIVKDGDIVYLNVIHSNE